MLITHSSVLTGFASVEFHTSVDGVACFETVVNHVEGDWSTTAVGAAGPVVLRGNVSPSEAGSDAASRIQPEIEAAISAGRI